MRNLQVLSSEKPKREESVRTSIHSPVMLFFTGAHSVTSRLEERTARTQLPQGEQEV